MKKMKKKEKKARKKIEKQREEYLRNSNWHVKTDEEETGQEETGQEDKHWEGLISILAGEEKLLKDIKLNLLIIIKEMQLTKEEKKHDGY